MKTMICGVLMAGLAMVTIGCEASIKPTHDSDTNSSTYEKKTVTTEHPNGTSETHTETKSD